MTTSTLPKASHPTGTPAPSYSLLPPPAGVRPPQLDELQQRVVDHPGGPLLVLAGPGTGKTTTLVEAIVDRIENRRATPDSVLALTFSRKAAEQLRDRVTARLGRTTTSQLSSTFHSFAYSLVRAYAPAEIYAGPLRLLSAPEQDVILRELLRDTPESVTWPEPLRHALGTRGFAGEVHAVLSRAREKGLDGEALEALGQQEGIVEFVAAGRFLEQYLQTLDDAAATDYADLIRRAVIEAQVHKPELRARYSHVFVDEYQDTDPGQVALLRAIAGDGRNLTVVGDPHQSIYGFRGAEVRGILDFPSQFPKGDGSAADVVALRTTRRFGSRLLVASQRVAGRLSLPGSIPAEAREAFLSPRAAGDHGEGRAQVFTFDTERAEVEHIADLLRRAHLEDGLDWDQMAVLVRSGRATIPALRRSLGAAGVPVEVAADDLPLVRDPAVLPLLDALRAVINLDNEVVDHVDHVDPGRAESLLTGPLGGLDAGEVRRLARLLRQREKAQLADGTDPEAVPRRSRDLVRLAVVAEGFLDGLDQSDRAVARAQALSALLHDCRARIDQGMGAEEALWALWDGTDWPHRLRRGVEAGGAAARRAHRDLDAVVALFEAAARAEEQRDHAGVRSFLDTLVAQEIPSDTLAERGVRGAAVRLLTAHRSKGLEWPLVVVAHVQAEGWPDLRRRSTLLRADRIGVDGLVPPVTARELLVEERRLFYVASTRARHRLVVTAVRSSDDDGEQPSRFLGELGVQVEHVAGRPRRPLSMAGLVSELRRTLTDPATPDTLRAAAARRLARLATETTGAGPAERQLVPQADPASWWGTRGASRSVRPLRDPEVPVPISATVLEQVLTCPLHYFLEREAGGSAAAHQSANVGQLVHAVADRVAKGELGHDPDDLEPLMAAVDAVWERLEFRTPWSRAREYSRVRVALARFLRWHHHNPRELLATEQRFSAVLDLPEGERVRLTGYADRVELDADGRVVVVDLKTSRTKPTKPAVDKHVQLGLYQLAVDHGAVDNLVESPPGTSGGGELIQLGLEDGKDDAVAQPQPPYDDDSAVRTDLRAGLTATAAMLRSERFPAVPGDHCRDCPFVPICPAKSAGAVTA